MKKTIRLVTVALIALFTASGAFAQTWSPLVAGTYDWNDNGNWATSPFPNAEGATAGLNVNRTGAQVINLNEVITIGTLNLGDTGSTYYTTEVAAGTAGSLIMDVASGNATISKTTSANTAADTISANILLNDNLVVNNAATSASGLIAISGIISGVGRTLEKTGAGVLQLSNANTYSGTTTVTTGTLRLGSGLTGGNGSVAGNIVNNATLQFNNADAQSFSGANYSGTGTLSKTAAGTLTLSGATTAGTLFIGRNGAGGTVTMGSGATVSVGTAAANSFEVGTNTGGSNPVGNGTFNAQGLTAKVGIFAVGYSYAPTSQSGTSTGVLTLSGAGAIQADKFYIGVGESSGAGGNFAANGSFSLASGGTLNLSGTTGAGASLLVGWSFGGGNASKEVGDMNLSSGAADLTLSQLSVGRASRVAAGTGTLTLSSSHSNHLVVSGAGTVVTIGESATGGTQIGSGTVTLSNLDATSAITSTDNSTAIILGNAVSTATGTLNLSDGTLTITTTGSAIAKGTGKGYLTLDNMTLIAGASNATSGKWITGLTSATLTNTVTFDSGVHTISTDQVFTGTGGLIKDGDGTLTISGTQVYTGATEIQAGELSLTGSLNAASVVTVKSGATIGGSGTINGSLDFEAGAKLNLAGATIGETSTGVLDVVSSITLTNFALSNIIGWDWAAADVGTYTLINGGISVILAGTTPIESDPYDFGNGKQGYFKEGSLQLVVIPEPGTLSMIGVIGIAMLLRRRMVK